jgi:hypothetical protein
MDDGNGASAARGWINYGVSPKVCLECMIIVMAL